MKSNNNKEKSFVSFSKLIQNDFISCTKDTLSSNNNFSCDTRFDQEWLTSVQAATFLGMSTQALMNCCSNGKVPFYKFGRRNRYRRSELESLLSSERRGPNYGN